MNYIKHNIHMKLNVGKEMSLMRKRILGQYKQIKT